MNASKGHSTSTLQTTTQQTSTKIAAITTSYFTSPSSSTKLSSTVSTGYSSSSSSTKLSSSTIFTTDYSTDSPQTFVSLTIQPIISTTYIQTMQSSEAPNTLFVSPAGTGKGCFKRDTSL